MADILTADEAIVPGGASANAERVARVSGYEGTMTALTKSLVKGSGQATGQRGATGANLTDDTKILSKSHQAIIDLRAGGVDGRWNSDRVTAGINPELWQHPGAHAFGVGGLGGKLASDGETRKAMDATLNKSFTALNQATSGQPYGLVPFDLLAPSRLIYPVN